MHEKKLSVVIPNLLRIKTELLSSPWIALAHDLIMVPVAWLLAYWFRYNLGNMPVGFLQISIQLLPFVVVIQGLAFGYYGLYRGVWRFTSIPDLLRISKAVAAGAIAVAVLFFFIHRGTAVPRSVLVLYPVLLLIFLSGPRLFYRTFKDRFLNTSMDKKILVVGAGAAGEMLVRDLLKHSPRIYQPVAFIDDNPIKLGREIRGIRVIGNASTIPHMVEKWGVEMVVLALPSANSNQMRRIVEICEHANIPFRTLPMLHDLLSCRVSQNEIREVEISDLLGRDPVTLDWDKVQTTLTNKVVLVTGGGGSIGYELCRQIAHTIPTKLILLDNSEYNLYKADQTIREEFKQLDLVCCLGDVCDSVRVDHLMQNHQPDIIFHAAAYKHVPLLEDQIREAVKNNILGTKTIAKAADNGHCEAFVLVSTDKAVNPSNVMGACKRVAEIYCQTLNQNSDTQYITVRFGNVLGSAGSVVPLFKEQIAKGGPITVTHPDITRYFMTIQEASQLILQACAMGSGGEIYVLDMGETIKIRYLAEQMILLSDMKPGKDIKIIYTGLRAGEKLYEELFHKEENLIDTQHSKILLASSRMVDWQHVNDVIEEMTEKVTNHDCDELEQLLFLLVPENMRQAGIICSPTSSFCR